MLVNKDFHQPPAQCVFSLNMKHERSYGALAKEILLKLSVTRCVRVEVRSVESNETTAAAVI